MSISDRQYRSVVNSDGYQHYSASNVPENALKVTHVLWSRHEKTMNGLQKKLPLFQVKKVGEQHPKENTVTETIREGGRARTNEN